MIIQNPNLKKHSKRFRLYNDQKYHLIIQKITIFDNFSRIVE